MRITIRLAAIFTFSFSFVRSVTAAEPQEYSINYSSHSCFVDPDSSPVDSDGRGIHNDTTAHAYVYCPMNYISYWKDSCGSSSSIYPASGGNNRSVRLWYCDGTADSSVFCRVYGVSTSSTGGYFDYDFTGSFDSGTATTGCGSFSWNYSQLDLLDYDDFLSVYCRLPARASGGGGWPSQIAGYRFTADES
jgi:hypothetical protein